MAKTQFSDMLGARYGRLTVLEFLPEGPLAKWRCRCDCGKVLEMKQMSLRSGNTQSCGCLRLDVSRERATRHGMARHPAYESYMGAKKRCENPKSQDYDYYGGRGIKFLLPDFAEFWEILGPSWYVGATIDRTDNSGDYIIGNVKWATRAEQSLNTRRVRMLTLNGVTKNLKEWAETLGLSPSSLRERLERWPLEKALSLPKLDQLNPLK